MSNDYNNMEQEMEIILVRHIFERQFCDGSEWVDDDDGQWMSRVFWVFDKLDRVI